MSYAAECKQTNRRTRTSYTHRLREAAWVMTVMMNMTIARNDDDDAVDDDDMTMMFAC